MPKFCANLTMLYNEVDFLDRFEYKPKTATVEGLGWLKGRL